jgi:hypothetical protein
MLLGSIELSLCARRIASIEEDAIEIHGGGCSKANDSTYGSAQTSRPCREVEI